jgi:hypothetical protein
VAGAEGGQHCLSVPTLLRGAGASQRRRHQPNSAGPHKGPLCPATGKCRRPQRRGWPGGGGRSHSQPGVGQVGAARGRPAVPWLQRSCRPGPRTRDTGGREDLPSALRPAADTARSAWQGRFPAHTPARQLLRECSKRSRSPGVGSAGGAWGVGGGWAESWALGSAAAAQLHPGQLSRAARSISMKRPDADEHSGSSQE